MYEGETVTSIDRKSESVCFPSSVKYIDNSSCAFASISSLNLEETNIIIIGKYSFANCYYLESVIFPTSLEEICDGSFQNCRNLENICFPSDCHLKRIGVKAFYYCTSLLSFDFPPLLEEIGDLAFGQGRIERFQDFDLRNTRIKHLRYDVFSASSGKIILPLTISALSIINNNFSQLVIPEDHPVIKKINVDITIHSIQLSIETSIIQEII